MGASHSRGPHAVKRLALFAGLASILLPTVAAAVVATTPPPLVPTAGGLVQAQPTTCYDGSGNVCGGGSGGAGGPATLAPGAVSSGAYLAGSIVDLGLGNGLTANTLNYWTRLSKVDLDTLVANSPSLNGDGGANVHIVNTVPVTISGSTLIYDTPTTNANGAFQPNIGTVNSTGNCSIYKATTGNHFEFSALVPGATFLYVIDASTRPGDSPSTFPVTLLDNAQTTGSGNFGIVMAPIPVPANGFVAVSARFPVNFGNGLVICAATSATVMLLTNTPPTSWHVYPKWN